MPRLEGVVHGQDMAHAKEKEADKKENEPAQLSSSVAEGAAAGAKFKGKPKAPPPPPSPPPPDAKTATEWSTYTSFPKLSEEVEDERRAEADKPAEKTKKREWRWSRGSRGS